MLEPNTRTKRHRTPRAAEYLGLSASTLEKYRLYGGGPTYYRIGKKIIVYEEADLDTWLRSQRCKHT